MGTTLTGTTPQDTYDSLIKVTDNGPLSGSLKKLTDGLGNDSSLSLSTAAATVTGTLSATSLRSGATGSFGFNTANNGEFQIYAQAVDGMVLAGRGSTHDMIITNKNGGDVFRIPTGTTNASFVGNVGIGTSSPSYKLDVSGISSSNTGFLISSGQYDNIGQTPYTGMFMTGSSSTDGFGALLLTSRTDLARPIIFGTSNGSISVERVRIDANGLKFNGDTAAANALDDYEEGTWTPTLGSDGTGAFTIDTANGKYTKIGNMVRITGYIAWSANTCTGNGILAGLPFGINFTPNPQAQGILIHEGTVSQGLHFRHDGATTTSQGYSYSFGGSIQNVSVFGSSGNIAVNATYFV